MRSINEQVLAWLGANPGYHRPVNIAHAIGLDTHTVAKACNRLDGKGRILRLRQAGRPASVYAHPDNK